MMRPHRDTRFGRASAAGLLALSLVMALVFAPAATHAETDDCAFWDEHPSTGSANEEYLPASDPDPFYAQPDPMPCARLGTILDVRPIMFTPTPGLASPNEAWHL